MANDLGLGLNIQYSGHLLRLCTSYNAFAFQETNSGLNLMCHLFSTKPEIFKYYIKLFPIYQSTLNLLYL